MKNSRKQLRKARLNLCFLILHFKEDIRVLSKCIFYIRNIDSKGIYKIIVVDNQGDMSEYIENLSLNQDIDLVISGDNCGFSRGNNIGFHYIKERYLVDYLIVMNPDVYIKQKSFALKLFDQYSKEDFWVAGPTIFNPMRYYYQNPYFVHDDIQDLYKYRNHIIKMRKYYSKVISFYGIKEFLKEKCKYNAVLRVLYKYLHIFEWKLGYNSKPKRFDGKYKGLQGSCLIFDHRFIENNSDVFSPETFLYFEEDLLYIRCKQNNWKMRFLPELYVEHLSEESSNYSKMTYKELCDMKSTKEDILLVSLNRYMEIIKEYLNER